MKKNLFTRLIETGSQHEMPEHIKRRLVPTNIISLVLFLGIATPFIVITLVYFPSLVIYPIGGAVVTSLAIILNHYNGLRYSRIIVSIAPILLGASYNAYLSGADDDPLPSLYLIELSFSLIPFVVFDLKEKWYLILITIFCGAVILTFPITKHWVHSDYDSTILRTGWLGTLTIALSIIGEIGLILGLAYINRKSEEKSDKLLTDMDEKNKTLQNSQKELEENLKKVEEAQSEEQKRNWAAQGIANISEILRSNKESKEVFDEITSTIVNYLKANQGGLYLIENDDKQEDVVIKLHSCYAFSRKKFIDHEYKPGEGLLGQTYLEGQHIYMTNIPDNYIRITSGLGDANPKALLIIPFKVNDIIEGIFEVASFNKFEDYQIEFVEKVGEIVASYIQTNKINQRTNKLLKEAQEQTEELRAQEEEMRQNMEELAATQEELDRKEREYRRIIDELKSELSTFK